MKQRTPMLTRDDWAKRVGKLPPGEVLPEVPAMLKYVESEVSFAKDVDPQTGMRDIKFVISTSAIDRDDDIIDVNGWDLENYKKNPVVLWGHDYGGLPVAQATSIGIEDDKLVAVDRFTPQDVNPFGYMVYRLVEGKFLRATSVGFRPRQYVFNDDHKGYDFSEQELLEHSIVPVPSNPEALMAASAQGIDLAPMKEFAETILDGGPDGNSVALWLPKDTVEIVHAALSNVAVSLTGTGTSDGPADVEISSSGGTTLGNSDPMGYQTDTTVWPVGSTTPDIKINTEPLEADMELSEAIQALSDVVRELNESVEKLPAEVASKVAEAVSEKLTENAVEKDPPDDDDINEDDIKSIVQEAVQAALTSTTGELPV
jgi:HK97 family phage prohead protease